MISDTLCEAEWDIRSYQKISPENYGAAAKEVEVVLTVMESLIRYLDCAPIPFEESPDYFQKHDPIREAVRRLDVSEIVIAMREFKPVGKRRKPSYLGNGAIVLGRAVEKIRQYQQPPRGGSYEFLKEEIEVVVTVMTGLQVYLNALAVPVPKYQDKVKALSEALQRLELDRCKRSMKEMYDFMGSCSARSSPNDRAHSDEGELG